MRPRLEYRLSSFIFLATMSGFISAFAQEIAQKKDVDWASMEVSCKKDFRPGSPLICECMATLLSKQPTSNPQTVFDPIIDRLPGITQESWIDAFTACLVALNSR